MAPFDVYAKAAAAIISAGFAVSILLATRRRAAVWFAVFLALISLNQGAEWMRALAVEPAARVAWFRVASVAAALDPLAYWLFASALLATPRSRGADARVALACGALALFAGWGLSAEPSRALATQVYPLLLTLLTVSVYLAVLIGSVRRLREEPSAPAWRSFAPAALLVAVPTTLHAARYTASFTELFLSESWTRYGIAFVASLAATGALLLATHLATRDLPGPARRSMRAGIGLGVLLLALMAAAGSTDLVEALAPGSVALTAALTDVGRSTTALRWLLVGALGSLAICRDGLFDVGVAARRRSARVLLGLAFILGASILLLVLNALLRAEGQALSAAEMGLLLVAVVLSQSFRRVVDVVAARVYAVPMPGDVSAAHDVYRRAAGEVMAEGRAPAEDAALRQLREDLAIDDASARALERIATPSAGALRAGTLVAGRYRVERYLGRGGTGRTFLARDTLLARDVALKEVPRATGAIAEARAASRLRHPCIVAVFDVIERDETALIVTEYVDGGTLADRVEGGRLRGEQAERLAVDLVEALAAVHAEGIVHGDVKPANVLLLRSGSAKLSDFGLARDARQTTAVHPRARPGTPAFMAPEVVEGARPDHRADVFSAGLTLARSVEHASLRPLIERATSPRAAERFADGQEMLAELRRVLNSSIAGANAPPR